MDTTKKRLTAEEFGKALDAIGEAKRRSDPAYIEARRQRLDAVRERIGLVVTLLDNMEVIAADILDVAASDDSFTADNVDALATKLSQKYAQLTGIASAEASRSEPLLPAIPDCNDEELPEAFGVELHDEQDFTNIKPLDLKL